MKFFCGFANSIHPIFHIFQFRTLRRHQLEVFIARLACACKWEFHRGREPTPWRASRARDIAGKGSILVDQGLQDDALLMIGDSQEELQLDRSSIVRSAETFPRCVWPALYVPNLNSSSKNSFRDATFSP